MKQKQSFTFELVWILLFLLLADLGFTLLGLSLGFQEANPVINLLLSLNINLIFILMVFFITQVCVIFLIIKSFSKQADNILLFICGWKFCVVMNWVGVFIR